MYSKLKPVFNVHEGVLQLVVLLLQLADGFGLLLSQQLELLQTGVTIFGRNKHKKIDAFFLFFFSKCLFLGLKKLSSIEIKCKFFNY